jgi:hypothetical protein
MYWNRNIVSIQRTELIYRPMPTTYRARSQEVVQHGDRSTYLSLPLTKPAHNSDQVPSSSRTRGRSKTCPRKSIALHFCTCGMRSSMWNKVHREPFLHEDTAYFCHAGRRCRNPKLVRRETDGSTQTRREDQGTYLPVLRACEIQDRIPRIIGYQPLESRSMN